MIMTVSTRPFTGTFVVDPVHSSVEFAVRHMGVSLFRARFEELSARLVTGDAQVRLEGSAPVESVSIRSPRQFRDHVVFGADFFDAGNHPEIKVAADEITLNEDGTATGTYHAPIESLYGQVRGALELTATIDRRDWGLDWQAPLPSGGDALGNDVQLSAHLELVEEA
jgi:polyisoprenoid-binding protein YceI